MSNQETQTAMTAHGEVEYATVSCKNCGNDMMENDAVYVGMGLHTATCDETLCEGTYNTYRESVPLCEYCAKETVGYSGRIRQEINVPQSSLGWITVIAAVSIGLLLGFSIAKNAILVLESALTLSVLLFPFIIGKFLDWI